MPYLGNRPDNVVIRNAQQEFNYTATSSQTTFTGADSNNNTLAYNVGNVEVFFNGARLEEADFTATNGTSIVLASAAATNDLISVVATDVFESTDTVSKANGGTFSSNVTVSGLLTADNISTGGYIRGPSSLTIDPATHGDNTGTVVIAGDLTVNGTTTQVNSNTVNIGDNILVLNSDEAGTPSQNSGIEIERGTSTNVAFRWNETTDKWQFTNDGSSYIDLGESDLVGDTTPQLGGDLDANTKNITNVANIEIDNLKLDGNTISSTDSNGNINLSPNGTGKVYITNDSYSSTLIVESTIDGTQTAPDIDLYKNSASPATYDYLGNLLFHGNNSNGDKHLFAQVLAMNYGNTAGAERGAMQFWSLIDGVNYNRLWWAHGGLVINESGINSYTRIEGLNDQNLVYVDAANDRVGIGTSTPDEKLQVIGSVDIGPNTIPWARTTSSDYNSLSVSGNNSSGSGFLYLGSGATTTNADFDLYRIYGQNGATQVSQISTATNTGANDDGRLEFYTKSTGASLSNSMTIEADGTITSEGRGLTIDNSDASWHAINISESIDSRIAFRINPSREGQTKGISMGAIGTNTTDTGLQAYDTSNNTANDFLINPWGGNVGIGIASGPGTSLHIKDAITNPNTISSNITIPASSNSMMAGPITLNATVTIPSGSSWTIV